MVQMPLSYMDNSQMLIGSLGEQGGGGELLKLNWSVYKNTNIQSEWWM